MNVFIDQIWVCVYFACDLLARPPSPGHPKAVQAAEKLIKDITKSFVINKYGPHLWLISKSASFDPVTSEFKSLNAANKKKLPRIRTTGLHAIKLIFFHETNA